MDASETDNDVDDDGDGLIDEGALHYETENVRVTLLDGVETCEFTLDGSVLIFALHIARLDSSRRVRRAVVERRIYLRNN